MTESEPAETRKKSWRVFGLASMLLMVIPILTCGGVLTWFFGRQIVAARALAERIEDLKSRGEPFNDQSMQELYERKTSDVNMNAWIEINEKLRAPEFAKATMNLPIFSETDENEQPRLIPSPGQGWADRKSVDEFFLNWNPVVDEIIFLADDQLNEFAKPVRRPIKFQSLATELTDSQETRTLARLIALKHAVAVYDGDSKTAYQCLRAIRGLERSLDSEPFTMSFLIKVAINHFGNEMLEKSLAHDLLNDEQLEQCAKDIRGYEHFRESVRYALIGERGMILPLFMDSQKASEALGEQSAGSGLLSKLRSKDAMLYIDLMDEAINLPEDMMGFCVGAQELTERFAKESQELGPIGKLDRSLTTQLFCSVEVFSAVLVRITEENRLAKLSIAARRFQKTNQRWPEGLHELADFVDLELLVPMGNAAFGYQIEKSGDAVLWGVNRFPDNDFTAKVPLKPYTDKELDKDQPGLIWQMAP